MEAFVTGYLMTLGVAAGILTVAGILAAGRLLPLAVAYLVAVVFVLKSRWRR